jgi:hypothetical protein
MSTARVFSLKTTRRPSVAAVTTPPGPIAPLLCMGAGLALLLGLQLLWIGSVVEAARALGPSLRVLAVIGSFDLATR